MKNHHISEAGVSFEIEFGLCIKIWAEERIFLHMAANYRLKTNILLYTLYRRELENTGAGWF